MLAPNRSQAIAPIALSNIGGGYAKKAEGEVGNFVHKVIDEEIKEYVLDAALHKPQALVWQQQLNGRKGIVFGSKGTPAQQEAFTRLFDGVKLSDIVENGKLTPIAQEYFKN